MDSQTVRVRNTRVPHKKKLLTRLLSSASPLPLSKACSRWTRGSWPKMGWMCQQNPWIFLIAGLSLYFLLMDIRVNNMKKWKCKQEFYLCESFISRPFQLFFQLVQPFDGSDISVKGVMQVSCSTIHCVFSFIGTRITTTRNCVQWALAFSPLQAPNIAYMEMPLAALIEHSLALSSWTTPNQVNQVDPILLDCILPNEPVIFILAKKKLHVTWRFWTKGGH